MSQIKDLLAKVANKDSVAFQQLYDQFADRVYRYAFTILHNKHLAEEIAQETMVAVWKGADRFAGRSKASTWIFGIARNQAFTLLRKEKRAENVVVPELVQADPSKHIIQRERVMTALDELSADHREVVYLTFYEGLSYGEIAGILEIPAGTVKSRMFHAKRKLAEVLT
ncbi:RNA polymerase sigma factor [Candidatus Bipolaricaulota bacterium]